ncbi:hypothetical protein JCM3765_006860 [Sporobolomyces pararoseus]
MSTELSERPESTPPRIDRLSKLPNELLDEIFQYTYDAHPPRSPLSKRLLPFFEKHRYHRVVFLRNGYRQLYSFLDSIACQPQRVKYVISLDVRALNPSFNQVEFLLLNLPCLIHLGVPSETMKDRVRSKQLFSTLPNIKSVTTEPTENNVGFVDALDNFAFLSVLPSLNELQIINWSFGANPVFIEETNFSLSHVRTLRIESVIVEEPPVVGIVNSCPALRHLELVATHYQALDFTDCLSTITTDLESLTLDSDDEIPGVDEAALLRFTNLRSLTLGRGVYEPEIYTALQRLPLLRRIRLEGGPISPLKFLPLLRGPSRLVHLESITLDFGVGAKGFRVDSTAEEIGGCVEMDDWMIPQFRGWEEEDNWEQTGLPLSDVFGFKRLFEVAAESQVAIRGSVMEAVETLEEYWIEANNRAVLVVHHLKEDPGDSENFEMWLQHLREVQEGARNAGVSLPTLDVDALVPGRSSLFEIPRSKGKGSIYTL